MSKKGWIGTDLDGTLAKQDHWIGPGIIGEPIPEMVERIKWHLREGEDVRIFTARVGKDGWADQEAIARWCQKHVGRPLQITACKDHEMRFFYDDRAIQVEKNTGRLIGHYIL